VVDLIGELLYFTLNLFGMSPPNDDRWVIPIAIGLMALVIAFVTFALWMQGPLPTFR
jgi:hypothetical protein